MKKYLSIAFSIVLCLSALVSCAKQEPSPLTRATEPPLWFRNTITDHYFLGTDGKLYMGGETFASDANMENKTPTLPLTEKQLSELPEQVKAVLNENNRIDGVYPMHFVAEDIVDFSFDGRTFFLTSDGKLYAVRDSYGTEIGVPTLVSENVARVSEWAMPLMFILENGDLIVEDRWGDFGDFEGGTAYTGVSGHKLVKVAENARFAMGYGYTITYIDAYDQLWVAGYNDFGQLANGKYDEVLSKDYAAKIEAGTPISPEGYSHLKFYKALSDVKYVWVDGSNIFAIRNDNSLWGWGANEVGQVGAGTHGDGDPSTRDVITKPKKILENVIKIMDTSLSVDLVTANNSFMALTADGKLYAWGENLWGVLGNGYFIGKYQSLRNIIDEGLFSNNPVLVMEDVKDFSRAGLMGNVMYMALKNNGDLYTWGSSQHGEVGNGVCAENYMERMRDEFRVSSPGKILEDVVHIANYGGIGAITSDGTVWGWGMNPFGWEMSSDLDSYNDPNNINTVTMFAYPTKNPYISATISADGTVSFVPTPTE